MQRYYNFPTYANKSQFFSRFSIYGVLFPISYNYTLTKFHALKTHENVLRARTLVQPIIASTLLVNLNAKTPTYIRAEVNIKAGVRAVAAMRIVRRHKIHETRARDCSLVSGILTKIVSLLFFPNSVHNLTNIFLYFRRKSHGCVRVRTRNYFLYFYIINVYY